MNMYILKQIYFP